MQFTTLGNSGLSVSRLSLGSLTFTKGNSGIASVYRVDATLADQMVGRALDAGVNFFDSADVYAGGESEMLLGAALKPHRDKVVLTTKVGNRKRAGLSRDHILKSIDESLTRLGTDRVDYYVAHREDWNTPLEETLAAFDEVVRAGKVRFLGFSNWSAWTVAAAMEIQKANGLAPFSHGQIYYSLLGRDVERDMVPMMNRYGLGMTVWSPLAFGFLAGRYSRADLDRPGNRFSDFDMLRFDRDRAFALLDIMRPIAEARGISMAQLAIAWLLAKQAVGSVIVGATSMTQLEDNLGAAMVALSAEEVEALDTATDLAPEYPTAHWIASQGR